MKTKLAFGSLLFAFCGAAAFDWTTNEDGSANKPPAVQLPPAPTSSRTLPSAAPALPLAAAVPASSGGLLIRHDVKVTDVDPAAVQEPNARTNVPNNHLTLLPSDPAQRKGRLFLFVGGTGSSELITQEIMYAGAERGYHSVAIAYPNYDAIVPRCLLALDKECTAKIREEILTGENLSFKIAVAPKDAMEIRLQRYLAYMAATYPAEDWGQFLVGGQVDWSKVSAVGHSQGAGQVAMLAKRHAMFRAVMISGVADITLLGTPAPWLRRPNVTPVERQYGFTHTADFVVSLPVARASWEAIGLQGPLSMTDAQQPDYGGAHMLTTALAPKAGANAHVSMLEDDTMSRNADGTPAHAAVWAYMAFP